MKGILPEVRVSRMGIRKKMLLMYATVIFTMTVVTAVIFMWMNKRYAEMLYQETTDSLFLISNEMKLYLDGIEADSYYMVADASLQSNLSAYQSAADGWQKRKLRNQIESSVYNYAVGNKYIRSVTLITPEFSVCRGSSSVQESEAYLEQLKQQANEENGKAFWAVSQEDPSTILMVRSYREIHNLSLKTLGYQIFRVDMKRIANQLMENYSYLTSEIPLIILDQKTSTILYPDPTQIQENTITMIQQLPEDGYKIIRDGKKNLFSVVHMVEKPRWRYYLFIPYNSIFSSIQNCILTVFFSLLVITVAMLVAAGWFSAGMCKHFSILQMKMKRVSSGNLEPMATDCNYQDRGDEIGFLNCCFDQMLLDLRRLTEENEKKQQLLREAQIRSLEQQMNPHFLYNTLDLVYWKAKINGESLYEAATMDGANKWHKIVNIDLPSLVPTATVMFILRMGSVMSVGFEKVYLLQNNLNSSSSEIISTYVYKMGLVSNQYSLSAAIGLFNNIINLVLLIAVNMIAKKVSDTSLV